MKLRASPGPGLQRAATLHLGKASGQHLLPKSSSCWEHPRCHFRRLPAWVFLGFSREISDIGFRVLHGKFRILHGKFRVRYGFGFFWILPVMAFFGFFMADFGYCTPFLGIDWPPKLLSIEALNFAGWSFYFWFSTRAELQIPSLQAHMKLSSHRALTSASASQLARLQASLSSHCLGDNAQR